MDTGVLLKGILLGFSIAAPVGPIGVLVIRRTLSDGRLVGFVSGLGAATADAFYGTIAAFGITFVSSLLLSQQIWLRLIGGAFLCYLGMKAFRTQASEAARAEQYTSLVAAYASILFLTLTNPVTILSFAAIFAGVGVSVGGDYIAAMVLVAGVFAGSAAWWFLLSGGVSLFRSRFSLSGMRWVNRISGVIIVGMGALAMLSVGL